MLAVEAVQQHQHQQEEGEFTTLERLLRAGSISRNTQEALVMPTEVVLVPCQRTATQARSHHYLGEDPMSPEAMQTTQMHSYPNYCFSRWDPDAHCAVVSLPAKMSTT